MTIYLNASSHGLPSGETLQRMRRHLELEAEIGPLAAGDRVKDELTDIRANAAALIGAAPDRVGFASTTFATWLSIVARLQIAGKRLLVAPHEWGENVAALQVLAGNAGARIEILPGLDFAAPDLAPWQARIDDDVAAIFVPMVTSVSGHRYPVEAIGALPRPEPCKLVVDAAQALGQTEIDVSALGCDALVATCRKWLRGPRGTALFWLAPAADGALRVAEIEPFDANLSLRLGLGAAIAEAAQRSVAEIERQIGRLTAHAYKRARALGLDTLTGEAPRTGALCLGVPSERAAALRAALADCHVKWPNVETDEPRASDRPAHLEAMRIAPHVYNAIPEIDALFDTVSLALKSPAAPPLAAAGD